MGLTNTLAAVATKIDEKHYAKLTERHRGILAPGETITSTMSAVAPDKPQANTWLAAGGLVGYFIGSAIDRPKSRARMMAIRDHVGGPFSQFPESKNGYRIATTQLRVLVFDRKAKELISEGPITAMRVDSIDHSAELSSVIFSDGNEHVAVTTVRGTAGSIPVFASRFPSAAGQQPQAQPVMAAAAPAQGSVFEF